MVDGGPRDAGGPTDFHLTVTGYRVSILHGGLDRVGTIAQSAAPAHRYAIIADQITGALFGERVAAGLPGDRTIHQRFPAGEASKTRETWAALTDQLLAEGCGRDTTVIALGGGVTGDLAGFVAATFLRGVPYIQVPTSLLAMVDASIGGKTGVDTEHGKNLVGAFHRPAAVVIDPGALRTLPAAHLKAGLAEAIKHAVIADAALFQWIATRVSSLLRDPGGPAMTELIAHAVSIKARVVESDERESALRKTLNFGHTIGHAIERVSRYGVPHGEAVAIGMVAEARAAEAAGIADPGTADSIAAILAGAGLPIRLPAGMEAPEVLAATRGDKKTRRGSVEYALPSRVGQMAGEATGYAMRMADETMLRALSEPAR